MAAAVRGHHPARRAAGTGDGRSVRARRPGQWRAAAGGTDHPQPRMAAPGAGPASALGAFPAFPRLRNRPLARWQLVRAGRPDTGALGRRFRAGKPDGDLAGVSRPFPGGQCRAAGRVLSRLSRRDKRAARRWRRARGDPDAGPAHRYLFRTCLYRPLPGPYAAGIRRFAGGSRIADGVHRDRAAAGQRVVAAAGFPVLRSAGTGRILGPGHPGHGLGAALGCVHHAELFGIGRAGGARADGLPATDLPGPDRRGAEPAQYRHLVVRAAGGTGLCARQPGPDDDRPGAVDPPALRTGGLDGAGRILPRRRQPAGRGLAEHRCRQPGRPGGGDAVDHAGADRRPTGAAPDGGAGVCRAYARWLDGDAGRLCPDRAHRGSHRPGDAKRMSGSSATPRCAPTR